MILALIPGPIRRAVAWAVAGLVAFAVLLVNLKRQWAVARDLAASKAETKAHEVRNEVDNRIAVERDARDRLRSDWQE